MKSQHRGDQLILFTKDNKPAKREDQKASAAEADAFFSALKSQLDQLNTRPVSSSK